MTYEQMYDELITKMEKYHPSEDFNIIEAVYRFAVEAHGNQLRKSGEPYMIHPMSVALILADIRSDIETIAAGILHDVVEDTPFSYDDVRDMFGQEIADLVKGVTKLKSLKYVSKEEEQAENYRKLFFSMSDDIRVILIKISDRLHNMRTLQFMTDERQKKIAQETLEIYAPLAHRLGISKIRYQLEDLSFRYLKPTEYFDLVAKLKQKLSERQRIVVDTVDAIKRRLEKEDVDAKVVGRAKHFFSIYKKMVSQSKTLDQIYDLVAVRAIVPTKDDCYLVLGIIHDMFKPVPGRFKDYIAIKKSNNYQSIHTTIIGPSGAALEVQIRTKEMDRVAEYGIAAHWKYKQRHGGIVDTDSEVEKFAWLRQIIEWQIEMSDNKEYLNAVRADLNIYTDHVYCFTPKGDVINLLNGATPIDFAYAIHSAVGNKMIGARVGGHIVTFDYQLNNGDQVEIITSNNSRGPSLDWLKIVKSTQAKNKINQWFKKENKEENISRGKQLLEKEAVKKKSELPELHNKKRVGIILNRYGFSDWESLCAAVGHGGLKEGQVINRLIEEYQKEHDEGKTPENPIEKLLVEKNIIEQKERDKKRKKKSGILVRGVGDISVRFSKCCLPVPGDEIVAYVTRGRGVSVHRTDCSNIIHLDEVERNRLIEAEWSMAEKASDGYTYRTEIRILGEEKASLLVDISRALSEYDKLKITHISSKTAKTQVVMVIGIEVSSKEQLDKVCQRLINISGVYEVNRISA